MALSVRLKKDHEDRLNYLSKSTNRPKSFYVKELFERYYDDLEDIYLAERRLEEFKASGEKVLSIEEMRAAIDLDD
nr:hypothetical protein [uncultured Desulfobacter sp.]